MSPGAPVGVGARLGDLVLEEELGRGAFATVYRARDGLLERTVAVKVLHDLGDPAGSAAVERMLREARLTGGVASPHIVTLHRVHTIGPTAVGFELEFMDGGSLEERLSDGRAQPPEEARRVFRAVLLALQAAHERGVLHRDVKPANVLLGRDGAVKLTDFGLGRLLGDQQLSSQGAARIQGTPSYMAPEVISGADATPASDLWSAGVLLHRMLSGRLPFVAQSLPALFYALCEGLPEPLPAGLPDDLVRACEACLQRRPERRPASAAALLETLEGRRAKGAVRPAAAAPVAEPARRTSLVGRDAERERIEAALRRVLLGQPAAVLVTGPAGSGKSALLQEALERARASGAQTLEVRLTPAGGLQRPLLQSARRLLVVSAGNTTVDALREDRFGAAASALREVFSSDAPPDARDAQRRVWAFEGLFAGLAREAPLVVAIDDVHLADADDLKFLLDLRRSWAEAAVLPLFAVRTADVEASGETSHLLRRLQQEVAAQPGATAIALERLSDDAVYELAQRHLPEGRLDAAVADLVVRRGDGNPLHALEVLRHLLALGDVVQEEGRWRFRAGFTDAALPPRLRDLLAARLSGLSDADHGLLDVAAVDGTQVDAPLLADVTGMPLLRVLQTLQRVHRQHGLVVPDRDGFRFASALHRDTLYEELAPDLRREIHRLLAEQLERRTDAAGARHERLGAHWERAGHPERAREPLLRAAAEALSRQEHLRAADFARRAGLGPDVRDLELVRTHADLVAGLSGACFDLGRKADAETYVHTLGDAARAVGDEPLALRAAVRENDLAYEARGAKAVDTERLRRAAEVLPGGREKALACYDLAREALAARGDGESAERWLALAERICTEHRLPDLRASVIDYRGWLAARRGDAPGAEALYAESARLCLQQGRRTNAAVSDVNIVSSRLERGDIDGLTVPLEDAMRTFARVGFDAAVAFCHVQMARLRYAGGDARRALGDLNEALGILGRSSSPSSSAEALGELAHLRLARGELVEADDALARLERLAADSGQLGPGAHALTLRTLRHDLVGDVERADALEREALRSASEATDRDLRLGVAARLAEGRLLGRAGPSDPSLRALLPAVAPASDRSATYALAVVGAAECMHDAATSAERLQTAADELRQASPGDRRRERAALARLLAVESARRSGAADRCTTEVAIVLEEADRLEHVWLQLAALALCPTGASAARREALLTRLGGALPDGPARERLRARWRPRG